MRNKTNGGLEEVVGAVARDFTTGNMDRKMELLVRFGPLSTSWGDSLYLNNKMR